MESSIFEQIPGPVDDEEEDDDDHRLRLQQALDEQLDDDLLDDSFPDDSDSCDHDEEDDELSHHADDDFNEEDLSNIKLINGQEYRAADESYHVSPQKTLESGSSAHARFDTDALLNMSGSSDEYDHQPPSEAHYENVVSAPRASPPVPKKPSPPVPNARNQPPVQHKPTNFSSVSNFTEDTDSLCFDDLPTTLPIPPDTSPPPSQHFPQAPSHRQSPPHQPYQVLTAHGGSYLSNSTPPSHLHQDSASSRGSSPKSVTSNHLVASPARNSPRRSHAPPVPPRERGAGDFFTHTEPRRATSHAPTFAASSEPQHRVVYSKTPRGQVGQSLDATSHNGTAPPKMSLQEKFIDSGGMSEHQQLAQLKILHEARGKRLNEVTAQMEQREAEYNRQIRILQHELSMTTEGQSGLKYSLDQALATQNQLKDTIDQLHATVRSRDQQIESLSAAKKEAERQVVLLEKTVSSLNEQMTDLCKSDVMSRTREQHESTLANLTAKHHQQVYHLNTQLSHAQQQLQQMEEEKENLRSELSVSEEKRTTDRLKQASVINELTQSLENAQKQCRDLLQTNSAQEVCSLRSQLKQLTMSKSMTEQILKMAQEEATDLKTQLALYESVSSLGLGFFPDQEQQGGGDLHDDSVMNTTTYTPEGAPPSAEFVQKLKNELEKCLINNLAKRNRIDKLTSQVESCNQQMETLKASFAQLEAEKRDLELRVAILAQNSEKANHSPNSNEHRDFEREKSQLKKCISDLEEKNAETVKERKELSTKVATLTEQIEQMRQSFEKDKTASVERTRLTCLKMHEDAQQNLRAELERYSEEEKRQLTQHYEEELSSLREELDRVSEEADYAKTCFVKLSEETKIQEESSHLPDTAEVSCETDLSEKAEQMIQTEPLPDYETQLNNLRKEVEAMERAKCSLEESLKEREAEYSRQLAELQQVQSPVTPECGARDQEEVESLRKEREELRKQLNGRIELTKKKASDDLAAMEDVYRKTTEDLRRLLKEEGASRTKLEDDHWQLQEDYSQLQQQLQSTTKNLESLQLKLKNEREELQTKFTSESEKLRKEIARLKSEIRKLESSPEVKRSDNVTNSSAQTAEDVFSEMESKEQQYQKLISDLQRKLAHHGKLESRLKAELKHLKEKEVSESSQAILLMDKKIAEIQAKLQHKPVSAEKEIQTESDYADPDSIAEFRNSVVETIKVMKSDVVDYVLNRQKEICEVLRNELLNDQQQLSRQLQDNYMSALNQILTNDLLPKVQQDLQVTSDIRNLVNSMSENFNPNLSGELPSFDANGDCGPNSARDGQPDKLIQANGKPDPRMVRSTPVSPYGPPTLNHHVKPRYPEQDSGVRRNLNHHFEGRPRSGSGEMTIEAGGGSGFENYANRSHSLPRNMVKSNSAMQIKPIYSDYQPNYPATPRAGDPRYNNSAVNPAFSIYNSPSSHSDISTDTYANLPRSFSLLRSSHNGGATSHRSSHNF